MVTGERWAVVYLDPKGRQWTGDWRDKARTDWNLAQMRKAEGSRPLYRLRVIPKAGKQSEVGALTGVSYFDSV